MITKEFKMSKLRLSIGDKVKWTAGDVEGSVISKTRDKYQGTIYEILFNDGSKLFLSRGLVKLK